MNSMAIIYQVVSSCYQHPQFGKEILIKAATYTLKALKLYLKEVASYETVSETRWNLYCYELVQQATYLVTTYIGSSMDSLCFNYCITFAIYKNEMQRMMIKGGLSCLQIDSIGKAVSLHIPLHRTLSVILQKLVLLSWDGVKGGYISVLDFDYTKDEVWLRYHL